MDNIKPIGIFDSGVGGLSIWKEIVQLMPNEKTIYLADSKNAPYGEKSKEEIIALSIKNTEFLIKKGCKIIVVACNTATTNAITILREKYNIPFIGIEPAIKPAALQTKTNAIGILATKGTLNSALFAETAKKHLEGKLLIEQVGNGLVQLIENGDLHSKNMTELLQKYLKPMLAKNVDCLVLGCTHYPFLIPEIVKITGDTMTIIDSGLAVAKQTKAILENQSIISDNENSVLHEMYSNTDLKTMQQLLGKTYNVNFHCEDF